MDLIDYLIAIAIEKEYGQDHEDNFSRVSSDIADERHKFSRPRLRPLRQLAGQYGRVTGVERDPFLKAATEPWDASDRFGQRPRPFGVAGNELPVPGGHLLLKCNSHPQQWND